MDVTVLVENPCCRGTAMLSSQELYPLVQLWVHTLELASSSPALSALTHLLVAVLYGQSLRPSALMRALLSPTPVPARQRYKRVARFLGAPLLTPAWLTPRLVRAALALGAPAPWGPSGGQLLVVLDSVRCGPWEVFTLGVVWHGRLLPVSGAALPYPWPKGQVTPTVCRLLRQVGAVWPPGRPGHLLADRAFPSQKLFTTLRTLGWDWTVRLRAPMPVTADGVAQTVRDLLRQARPNGWTVWSGAYGQGRKALPATLGVGRGLVVLPQHQRTAGSQRPRTQRQAERLRVKRYRYATVSETDAWLVLCTTLPTWQDAVRSYRHRWATEGSYRDVQSGWDGQHGWDLEPVLTQARSAGQVEHLVGLWAVGALLQTWLGAQVAHGPAPVRAVAAQWTTTGRLSVWATGSWRCASPCWPPGSRTSCTRGPHGSPPAPGRSCAGAGGHAAVLSPTRGLSERCRYATSCPLLWVPVAW
jgi:Transposase DDE domain